MTIRVRLSNTVTNETLGRFVNFLFTQTRATGIVKGPEVGYFVHVPNDVPLAQHLMATLKTEFGESLESCTVVV